MQYQMEIGPRGRGRIPVKAFHVFLLCLCLAIPARAEKKGHTDPLPSPPIDQDRRQPRKPGKGRPVNPAIREEQPPAMEPEKAQDDEEKYDEAAEAFIKQFKKESKENEAAAEKYEKALAKADAEELWKLLERKYNALIPRMEALRAAGRTEDLANLVPIAEAMGMQLHQLVDGGNGQAFQKLKNMTKAQRSELKSSILVLLDDVQRNEDSVAWGEAFLAKFKKLDGDTQLAVRSSAGKDFVKLARAVSADIRAAAAKPDKDSLYHPDFEKKGLITINLARHREKIVGLSDEKIAADRPKANKKNYELYRTASSAAESFESLWLQTGRPGEALGGVTEISEKFFDDSIR